MGIWAKRILAAGEATLASLVIVFLLVFVAGFIAYTSAKFPILLWAYTLFLSLFYFFGSFGLIVAIFGGFKKNDDWIFPNHQYTTSESVRFILVTFCILILMNNFIIYLILLWNVRIDSLYSYILLIPNKILSYMFGFLFSLSSAILLVDKESAKAFVDGFSEGLKPNPEVIIGSKSGILGVSGKVLANIALSVISGFILIIAGKMFSKK